MEQAEQQRLPIETVAEGRTIPLAPARVALAIVTAMIGAFGLKIVGLHSGLLQPDFRFGLSEAVLMALAVLVVLSATFASDPMVRMGAYVVAVTVASWFGATQWWARLVVAACMVACGLLVPLVGRRINAAVRRRPSRKKPAGSGGPNGAASVTLVLLALAFVTLTGADMAFAIDDSVDICDGQATMVIGETSEEQIESTIDLAADPVIIELEGSRATYLFMAMSERTGDVAVWFDSFEPIGAADDVLGWADTIGSSEPSLYEVVLQRSGLLGTYQIHFFDSQGEQDRPAIELFPGRSRLRAEFAFRDNPEVERCAIDLNLVLRVEPYATLPGLSAMALVTASTVAISPRTNTTKGKESRGIATASPTRVAVTEAQLDPTRSPHAPSQPPPGSQPEVAVEAQPDGTFEIRLAFKLDHDEKALKKLEESGIERIAADDLFEHINITIAFDAKLNEYTAKLAGKFAQRDGKPWWRPLNIDIELAGEKKTYTVWPTANAGEVDARSTQEIEQPHA